MLAQEISKFPQECMLADRSSTYHATFDAPSHQQALQHEFEEGVKIYAKESIQGDWLSLSDRLMSCTNLLTRMKIMIS